jgi:polysaccharide biosynthesis protein PslA
MRMPKLPATEILSRVSSRAYQHDLNTTRQMYTPPFSNAKVPPANTGADVAGEQNRATYASNVVTDIDYAGHRIGKTASRMQILPDWSLVTPNRTTAQRQRFMRAKRAFDLAGATAGLVFLSPLLLGCAAAIKLTSPGPVLFRQNRYGLNGELFSIYKFRSMRLDLGDRSGVVQTVKGDARVTRIGAFLRRSSFDELPQLLNVLEGTMSIVGPRPHVPNMLAAGTRYEDFDRQYMDRHVMRPGITGLAQVRGFRGETDTYEAARGRLDFDLEYTRTATLWGDIKIILGTLRKEFLSGSGY